ncbi:DUF4241 domain-containing protein [Actinopolymorpha sp. B9G3]|uniref:DUF4241 domain-containing protein n=1 Tax=Actinopolymorpha sp. B9G3 TaxID=3158970 RepID=UPI0032D9037D
MAPIQPDLEGVFRSGARYRWSGDPRVSVQQVENAGYLHLPSGRILACDPTWGSGIAERVRPLMLVVEPGAYPVRLAVTCKDPPGPSREIAAVKIAFRELPVATWELARLEDQPHAAASFARLEVDSGKGCLVDSGACPALAASNDSLGSRRHKRAIEDIAQRDWINVLLDAEIGVNAVVFKCPLGDGVYPIWIGRTMAGEPVSVVAHLGLIQHSLGRIPD